MDPTVSIALVAGWLSLAFLLIQKIQLDDPEAREAKKKMEMAQKEMKDLQKRGKMDDKLLDELLKAQTTLMTKTMIPTMVVGFFAIFVFNKLAEVYSAFQLVLPWVIPLPALAFPPFVMTNTLGWLAWYIICSLGWSFLLRPVLGVKM